MAPTASYGLPRDAAPRARIEGAAIHDREALVVHRVLSRAGSRGGAAHEPPAVQRLTRSGAWSRTSFHFRKPHGEQLTGPDGRQYCVLSSPDPVYGSRNRVFPRSRTLPADPGLADRPASCSGATAHDRIPRLSPTRRAVMDAREAPRRAAAKIWLTAAIASLCAPSVASARVT